MQKLHPPKWPKILSRNWGENGGNASSSEITEHITGVKLPGTVAAAKVSRKCIGMASVP